MSLHQRGAPQGGRLLDEVVLDSRAGGGTAGIDPQFIEDGSDVGVDCGQTNDQAFGDLGIGQAFSQ